MICFCKGKGQRENYTGRKEMQKVIMVHRPLPCQAQREESGKREEGGFDRLTGRLANLREEYAMMSYCLCRPIT